MQDQLDRTGPGQDRTADRVQDAVLDYLDVPAAAARLGITVEGVRKRIQRGQLRAHKQDGRWYVVLLPRDDIQDTPDPVQDAPLDQSSTDRDVVVLALMERLDRAHRDNLELAGRCDWLQSELQQARARLESAEQEIRLLKAPTPTIVGVSDPAPAPVSNLSNGPATSANDQDSGVQQAHRRLWWQFWKT